MLIHAIFCWLLAFSFFPSSVTFSKLIYLLRPLKQFSLSGGSRCLRGSEAPQDLLSDCHSASKEDSMAAGGQNPEALLSLKGAHCQGSAVQQNLLQEKELNMQLSTNK
jgi:hypothetical protein